MTEHAAPSHCLNCGAAVANNFCSVCGQETVPHVPSVREFFHEFIGHYVALEGKLWNTLALMIFRPGRLTADYIAGRRARYVAPLRLYLTLSVLFFALLHYGPTEFKVVKPAAEAPNRIGLTDKKPDANTVRINSKLIGVNPAWDARIQQITAMPTDEAFALVRSKFFAYVPYAMFLIMPLFALYLKLLYLGSGRRYGEHMLFALHTNGFAFLLLGLIWVAPWTWLGTALFIWLLAYLPMAMRRVYGGSRKATAARWFVLMAMYTITVVAAIVGTVFVTTIVI
ncbi:DUF3667 domain-containing protein [Massilia sp. R2A-15]|uniref:DUF3667 domain-containing protein n=1 Tax=Massilia sp. R2A-15 TaxID=3064278 RepID=UPI002732B37A|nr:DUF3667 domain-containing protein [Massilia sp. R2A-15]WLI88633.1 DUF3667 domain-containing protein [Massilia sp. R2A-15]